MNTMTTAQKQAYDEATRNAEQLTFGTVYGYARISTPQQKIERQLTNISNFYKDAVIVQEAYTGTTTDRPAWNKLLKRVKAGDTIVFDEVSRMSRNAEEGFTAYQDLFNKGVKLVFLKERHIDTDIYKTALDTQLVKTGNKIIDCVLEGVNNALMELARQQIKMAFDTAQAEVDFMRKRTSEGVRNAQKRYLEEELNGVEHTKLNVGRQTGKKVTTKKSVEMKEQILKLADTFGGNLKDVEVIKILKIDRHTYYKYKKELKEQGR